ncbi:helix-turn-helix domain-containing protein [Deinococcus wulumuqiensis]|uniref:Excisionase n=1 Tax=Deinococcus wulumuqiensis TaxID=980427 RepID=A0AAV4K8G0_9DEIO|nr:helix-turn-helix domain-containing protein [Deinococcus wulumuqiensis]QII22388.1 helix-turn-helix domain-containing protein [Deinococcus wulumuqiensis R12]GGI69791.1 excisionase [Deinococcus wulumuqiensis]GGI95331.1 excisionase [Deinococcus wulumuqiensis]
MTASTFNPQVEEQQLLAAFARQLEQGGAVAINLPGQPALAASPVLVELLRASLKEFQEGNGVTLLTSKRELSAQEAAELLGVSRPYLVTHLLETGIIPYRKVGTHRRIALSDVQAFQMERDRQHALLDDIVADEQAAGMY